MLIQRRTDSLRLVKQHDHGMLSGEMAYRWRGVDGQSPLLPNRLLLAVSLHDLSWQSADLVPRLDPEQGIPFDFISYPVMERVALYRAGVNELERIDPYVALLVSGHYCAFAGMLDVDSFQASEKTRREKLVKQLGLNDREQARAREDLRLLQLFDVLTLFICLAPPSALVDSIPDWLDPSRFAAPAGFELSWRAEDELTFAPFPFTESYWLHVQHRDIPSGPYSEQEEVRKVWNDSELQTWRVRISGP